MDGHKIRLNKRPNWSFLPQSQMVPNKIDWHHENVARAMSYTLKCEGCKDYRPEIKVY